ncbi:MAG: DUF86 domain-containing protein [Methanoculleus sp.]|jgi:uncharacterized protein YutE (UPF0331/DUF86 family)|nr:DUF86 domain-containing protein [Methanoculleus sp.]
MDDLVRERILQKAEVLIDRIEFIERHLSDAVMNDRILRKALYKEFQEAVESATDICALIRRMLLSSAQDDYTNLDYLVDEGIIDRETGGDLKAANGLRNRLIHEYDGINDHIAYGAMQRLMPSLRRFSGEVLAWLNANRTRS